MITKMKDMVNNLSNEAKTHILASILMLIVVLFIILCVVNPDIFLVTLVLASLGAMVWVVLGILMILYHAAFDLVEKLLK